MKNIAIIIQKLSGGGAERTAANMSIDLQNDYNVTLIVFDASDASYKYGGDMIDLALPAKDGYFNKLHNIIKRIIAVKKIKKKKNIKCSISLMEGANIVNILSRTNDKIIISERNLISFFIKSKMGKLRESFMIKNADMTVTLSEIVRQDLINNFGANPQKVVTIYNSVDTKKFKMDDRIVDCGSKFSICTMGRLTNQKAQWHILRAFKVFHEEYPNSELIVLGQGELLEEYQQFLKKLEIENAVNFMGFISEPHNIIKKSDLFVFSSMVEGLGSVLLEALACGKAIISTDCDAGPREILAPTTEPTKKTKEMEIEEYGILVPVTEKDFFDKTILSPSTNELYIYQAMKKLHDDQALRINYETKALQRAKDFEPKRINEKWKEIINFL